MRRIVITGIGALTPMGNSWPEMWAGLLAGRSGVGRYETVDVTDLAVIIGGEIRHLDEKEAEINEKVSARKMDRASIFSVIATKRALADARLNPADLGETCGVVIGAGLAGLQTLQEQTENLLTKGPRSVSPFTIPVLMPNAAPANVTLAFNITGPAYNVASACSSSGHAIIDAYELLRRGDADIMVTGGTESSLTRLAISAFANMKATTKKFNDNPTKASRPFDLNRDGFVMSEGSCILILEDLEHARRRGATIYAEIVGYGMTMDAHHLVQPDVSGSGAMRAVRRALKTAGWEPAAIAGQTYVNAHGTSTKYNDLMETNTLKAVFGDAAKKLQISSTKSQMGHTIGAAAAIETAVCALALKHQEVPPTINYETPDPECDLDYIPNVARKTSISYCLNNTFGFGGHNVCLALQKVSSTEPGPK